MHQHLVEKYDYKTIEDTVLAFLSTVRLGEEYYGTKLFKEVRNAMYPRKPFEKSIYNAMNKLRIKGVIHYETTNKNKSVYILISRNSKQPEHRIKKLMLW